MEKDTTFSDTHAADEGLGVLQQHGLDVPPAPGGLALPLGIANNGFDVGRRELTQEPGLS